MSGGTLLPVKSSACQPGATALLYMQGIIRLLQQNQGMDDDTEDVAEEGAAEDEEVADPAE
jgi:hypothetical protein